MSTAAIVVLIVGGILVGCLLASLFVGRYREGEAPQRDWVATDELFTDPSTNRVMRVWVDGSGARHYVQERGASS